MLKHILVKWFLFQLYLRVKLRPKRARTNKRKRRTFGHQNTLTSLLNPCPVGSLLSFPLPLLPSQELWHQSCASYFQAPATNDSLARATISGSASLEFEGQECRGRKIGTQVCPWFRSQRTSLKRTGSGGFIFLSSDYHSEMVSSSWALFPKGIYAHRIGHKRAFPSLQWQPETACVTLKPYSGSCPFCLKFIDSLLPSS